MSGGVRQLIFASAGVLGLQGCSLSYYAQSINGHLDILAASQPIEKLIDRPSSSTELNQNLELARDIRQFAVDRLSLPDNGSYRNYVDTGRDFVTWSVFAAPELAPGVRTWCFPVVGCVPYRGYFSKEAAVRYAQQIREEGFDVHVGGVPAYSTLGLTRDPLLNTMLLYGESYLAGVIFHELSHQLIYVEDDAEFNEAFAVSVEEAGTVEWLKHRGQTTELVRFHATRKRNDDFVRLVAGTQDELTEIYKSDKSDAEKRVAKKAAIERLRTRYRRVRSIKWNGYKGYDGWFDAPINNAKLATIGVYNDLVPAFSRLLEICDGDYQRYYKSVVRIGKLEKADRRRALTQASRCN
ncbi:MAG: aminopeptidase [Rhizobiaceae bacterium]